MLTIKLSSCAKSAHTWTGQTAAGHLLGRLCMDRSTMNQRKQAQLLTEGIYIDIVNHKKLVSWVDRIISDSGIAEDWLTFISLSNENDNEKISDILGNQFGYTFEGSLIELLSIIAVKAYIEQANESEYIATIVVAKDSIDIDLTDADSTWAREKIERMDNYVEENEFNNESIEKAAKTVKELLSFAKKKHSDIFNFMVNYA